MAAPAADAPPDELCLICHCSYERPTPLPCGHWYCRACLSALPAHGVQREQACERCLPPLEAGRGADSDVLFDQACRRFVGVARQVERSGGVWSKLPLDLQEQLDEIISMYDAVVSKERASLHGVRSAEHLELLRKLVELGSTIHPHPQPHPQPHHQPHHHHRPPPPPEPPACPSTAAGKAESGGATEGGWL